MPAPKNLDFSKVAENLTDEEIISLLLMSEDSNKVIENLTEKKDDQKSKYPTDPYEFARDILGIELWAKQRQIADAVVKNRNVIVPASKGIGKSILAACLTCWWMSVYNDAVVITLAPSAKHVNSVIWRYIRQFGRKANLPGQILDTPQWKFGENAERTALGLSTFKRTKEEITSLQGYHSPHLLVIMDEAAAMDQLVFDTVRGLATSDDNRVLAIGNPIAKTGPFYNATLPGSSWKHIHISALETPNALAKKDVIPGITSYNWIKEAILDHCKPCETPEDAGINGFEFEGIWYEPDLYVITEILGLFPEESDKQLIPRAWVKTAQILEVNAEGQEIVVSIDVSLGGDDAAIIVRQGLKVIYLERKKPLNKKDPTGELVDWAMQIYREFDATTLFIDAIGVGAGVANGLRRNGIPTYDVIFSSSPMNGTLYANLRAEVYWTLRTLLQKELLELPEDDMLESELASMFVEYDRLGRLKLEDKSDIRARIGRSPDTADALAISFALGFKIDGDIYDRAKMRQLVGTGSSYRSGSQTIYGNDWSNYFRPEGSRWRGRPGSLRQMVRLSGRR